MSEAPMSAEEELYCSKCGEWRGQERYTCRQGGESVPKPAKQEAMSAEDRPRGASWRFPRKYPGPWRDEWRIAREGHWDPRNPRHVWAAFRRALSTAIMRGAERLHNRVRP